MTKRIHHLDKSGYNQAFGLPVGNTSTVQPTSTRSYNRLMAALIIMVAFLIMSLSLVPTTANAIPLIRGHVMVQIAPCDYDSDLVCQWTSTEWENEAGSIISTSVEMIEIK